MGEQPVETPVPTAAITPAPNAVVPAPAKPVTAEANLVAASPANTSSTNYPGNELGFKPIVAPALPISITKEEQLQALLEKYKTDQITPMEYHKQRAAILAEPDAMTH